MYHLIQKQNKNFQKYFFLGSFLMFFVLFTDTTSAAETPLHRFWSDSYRSHFFTMSIPEKDTIIANDPNWCYEATAYSVDTTKTATNRPVHRFWSATYRSHFYTVSEGEKANIIANDPNWSYEGIAYYIPIETTGHRPVHRFWSATYRSHFYTVNEGEKANIIANDPNWSYEGIAYYVSQTVPTAEENLCTKVIPVLGDDIRVGLWAYTRNDSRDNPFEIEAKNYPYVVKKEDGTILATVPAHTITEVTYGSNGELTISGPLTTINTSGDVLFEAADASAQNNIIFDVHQKNSSYDDYRGRIRIHYESTYDKLIWIINELPLEQYVWGIGEMTATGPAEYNKAMTAIFRSYGYYKMTKSTEHKYKDFDTVPDPSDQIYRGYVWEAAYPRIREAAEATRGKMVYYDNEPILTPFGSWTDGRTRNYADGHFNGECRDNDGTTSSLFPYLLGVADSWGKHASLSTCELAAGGNHMVGISANGALNLAGDHDWDWQRIITHYLSGISLQQKY